MTYIFDDIENFTDADFFQTIQYASNERIEKIKKYKFMIDKKISLIAYLLLTYGIKKEFEIEKIPEILTEKIGKPYLKNSNISFNLSHTRNGVMCSIYKNRVGCDVENVVEKIIPAKSILCPNEIKMIGDDTRYFTKIWTLKEAYSKCTGLGLTEKLDDIDFSRFVNNKIFEINDYLFFSNNKQNLHYSICVENIHEDIQQIQFLSKTELLKALLQMGSFANVGG